MATILPESHAQRVPLVNPQLDRPEAVEKFLVAMLVSRAPSVVKKRGRHNLGQAPQGQHSPPTGQTLILSLFRTEPASWSISIQLSAHDSRFDPGNSVNSARSWTHVFLSATRSTRWWRQPEQYRLRAFDRGWLRSTSHAGVEPVGFPAAPQCGLSGQFPKNFAATFPAPAS